MAMAPRIHPREFLLEDFIKPSGRPSDYPAAVAAVLNGAEVTPAIAAELGRTFGTSAEVWLNLQAQYAGAK